MNQKSKAVIALLGLLNLAQAQDNSTAPAPSTEEQTDSAPPPEEWSPNFTCAFTASVAYDFKDLNMIPKYVGLVEPSQCLEWCKQQQSKSQLNENLCCSQTTYTSQATGEQSADCYLDEATELKEAIDAWDARTGDAVSYQAVLLNPEIAENLFGLPDNILAIGITLLDLTFDIFVPIATYFIVGSGYELTVIIPMTVAATYMFFIDIIALFMVAEIELYDDFAGAGEIYSGAKCDFLVFFHLLDFVFSGTPLVLTGLVLYAIAEQEEGAEALLDDTAYTIVIVTFIISAIMFVLDAQQWLSFNNIGCEGQNIALNISSGGEGEGETEEGQSDEQI